MISYTINSCVKDFYLQCLKFHVVEKLSNNYSNIKYTGVEGICYTFIYNNDKLLTLYPLELDPNDENNKIGVMIYNTDGGFWKSVVITDKLSKLADRIMETLSQDQEVTDPLDKTLKLAEKADSYNSKDRMIKPSLESNLFK